MCSKNRPIFPIFVAYFKMEAFYKKALSHRIS